jgi:hypothetical protein
MRAPAAAPSDRDRPAPAKLEPGFDKAFGIRKGDPMELDPKLSLAIW